jgi:hypothetical protein
MLLLKNNQRIEIMPALTMKVIFATLLSFHKAAISSKDKSNKYYNGTKK